MQICLEVFAQRQQQLFYDPLSGTTRVSRYQKKHSPTHHPDHLIFISFFHLLWSIASSLFKLRAWQSLCTTSLHVLYGVPLGLEPSTSYSIHLVANRQTTTKTWLFGGGNNYCDTNSTVIFNRKDCKPIFINAWYIVNITRHGYSYDGRKGNHVW